MSLCRRILTALPLLLLLGVLSIAQEKPQTANGYLAVEGPVSTIMTAPFVRSTPDPLIFDGVTTTPK